jgi:hypothetical protein
MGFALATPNSSPLPAPQYISFSPLFSCNANPSIPHPIAQPAAQQQSGDQFESTSDSPSSYFQPSSSAAFGPGPFPVLEAPGNPPDLDIPNLGLYQKFVQQQEQGFKRRRVDEAVGGGGSHTSPSDYNGGLPIHPTPVFDQPQSQQFERHPPGFYGFTSPPKPTIAADAKKGAPGSSCHQCKNRREAENLNFCKNRVRRASDDKKKKICRKKFCDHCLIKFNYQPISTICADKSQMHDWTCPSCQGICVCAACRRKSESIQNAAHEPVRPLSPTTSFAHTIFADPEFTSVGNNADAQQMHLQLHLQQQHQQFDVQHQQQQQFDTQQPSFESQQQQLHDQHLPNTYFFNL